MTLKANVVYFLKTHIFSPRIFALNLLNQMFWIFVIAGSAIGMHRGFVAGLTGFLLGTVAGILFLGVSYALYCRRVTRENQKRHTAEPTSPGDVATRAAPEK